MTASILVRVDDPTRIGEARRRAIGLAESLGLDQTAAGAVGIVVTELATNALHHGGGGSVVLRAIDEAQGRAVEAIAVDAGPGIPDVGRAMTDGYSTRGTAGLGLGSISRMSTAFDVWSAPGKGTVVFARVGERARPAPFEVGGLSIAAPGETACGDDWVFDVDGARARLAVVDGLGHGAGAAAAASAATAAFDRARRRGLSELVEDVHGALRPTRGAAMGVAEIDPIERSVTFVGVGNIAGAIVANRAAGIRKQNVVSVSGILGHNVRKVQSFRYEWPTEAVLVLASDGLVTSWDLAKYPGLLQRHPSVIAGALFRDGTRGRDDVTVVAVRRRSAA